MTLCTSVYVVGPMPVHEVFNKCRELLSMPADIPAVDEPPKHEGEQWCLSTPPRIEFHTGLSCSYKRGEPLRTPEAARTCDEGCDDDCDGDHRWQPACTYELFLETQSVYLDELGRSSEGLHATVVARLGEWLDEQGVLWGWQSGTVGEVHWGEDKYERLRELFAGSVSAAAAFEDLVGPLIERGRAPAAIRRGPNS